MKNVLIWILQWLQGIQVLCQHGFPYFEPPHFPCVSAVSTVCWNNTRTKRDFTTTKGWNKKISLNLRRSFCLISQATNVLKGEYIIHLNSEIYSSVWSSKTLMQNIKVLRYKQIKKVYQIKKLLDNGQSSVLNSDVSYWFT